MQQIFQTPFGGGMVSAGLIAGQMLAAAPCPEPTADKWAVFHDLRVARAVFGVSDRDLTVLNALLSFLPARDLTDGAALVVHPSNASLSDRAHGMAESTLRRHLAALVRAGLIARRDSPNGKRYLARSLDGAARQAFGFDLRPLLVLAPRIAEAARETRRAEAEAQVARETAVLRLRDATKLALYLAENDGAVDPGIEARLAGARLALRRRLARGELDTLAADLSEMAAQLSARIAALYPAETEETGGNASENGRHQQNSNPDSYEFEPCQESGEGGSVAPDPLPLRLPLGLVLKACPDLLPYARDPVRDWRDLVALAGLVRGMMGISRDAWDDAQVVMGPETAAVTVAAILQRVDHIRAPGGYLRVLTAKARGGGFSPGPMIMALLSGANGRPV